MRYCGFRLATSGSRANNTPRLIPNPPKCRPIAPKRPIFNCFHPMGPQFGGNTTSNRDLSTSPRGKWRHLRRDPAGSRLFVPCIDSPLAQPPLGPRSPESRTYAQNVVRFAPNTPFLAHPAEVDCTLSTTPTIHRTTPPRNGGFCYHRTPVTACRRRVAPLWSQFPPDNKNKRGNRAPHALHRLGSTTPLCGTLLAIAWVVGSFGPCVAPCSGFFARPRDVVPQKCRT